MNAADAAAMYHSFGAKEEVTLLAQELGSGYQSLRKIRRSRIEKHRSSTWWTPTLTLRGDAEQTWHGLG